MPIEYLEEVPPHLRGSFSDDPEGRKSLEADGLQVTTRNTNTASRTTNTKSKWGKRCIMVLLVTPFLFLIVYCMLYIVGTDIKEQQSTASSASRTGESLPEGSSSNTDSTIESSAVNSSKVPKSTPSPTTPPALTKKPTAVLTTPPAPTLHPTEFSHDQTKGCLPDRFDNDQMDLSVDPEVNFGRLYPGMFICSKPYRKQNNNDKIPQRYRFGLDEDTLNVIWQDTETDETIVVMEKPDDVDESAEIYFTLTTDATMVYHYTDSQTNNATTLELPYATDGLNHPMQRKPSRCLSNHDCPYFHLHSEGVMVLNYIADDGTGWEARNFKRAYGL